MRNLVESILNKQHVESRELLETRLFSIVGDRLDEMKMAISARLSEGTQGVISEARSKKVAAGQSRKNLNPPQKKAVKKAKETRQSILDSNRKQAESQAARGREQQKESKSNLQTTLGTLKARTEAAREKEAELNQREADVNKKMAAADKILSGTEKNFRPSFKRDQPTFLHLEDAIKHHNDTISAIARTPMSKEERDGHLVYNANKALGHISDYVHWAHKTFDNNRRMAEKDNAPVAPHREELDNQISIAAHHFVSSVRSHPVMDARDAANEAAHIGLIHHPHVQNGLMAMAGDNDEHKAHIQSLIDLHSPPKKKGIMNRVKSALGLAEEYEYLNEEDAATEEQVQAALQALRAHAKTIKGEGSDEHWKKHAELENEVRRLMKARMSPEYLNRDPADDHPKTYRQGNRLDESTDEQRSDKSSTPVYRKGKLIGWKNEYGRINELDGPEI